MTQELAQKLRSVAPGIAIETRWEHDEFATWDIDDPSLSEHDFTAWSAEVRATAIVDGRIVTGSAFLGGTWEKFGDSPITSNPTISGYLPGMVEEALAELAPQLGESVTARYLAHQCATARDTITAVTV